MDNRLIVRLEFQDLRLDPFERLRHLCTQANLADRKITKGHQMFLRNADDGREDPCLVFRILAIHVAGLTLEGVHAEVGDHRSNKADQWVVPVPAFLHRERDFERFVADSRQHGLIVVENELAS